ncbi:SDR family NAD(P)-dependent oxidoreductase [Nocardia sp. NPDC046763]|uniref:SDR family NAD(P)-dependent oxidoreductase n=1 Tax=Nocardia sp. NPDC046763 TaxID=3155256 RepID=UPI0033C1960C
MSGVDPQRYGPWAVVTGGSEGVGRSFALELARAGIALLLVARRAEPLAATAAECRALGVQVRTLALDLTAPGAVGEIAAAVDDVEVGLLVLNAGANTHSAPFVDGDLDAFQRVIDLNVTVPLGLIHHFGRAMKTCGRGGILLVGSLAGYLGSQHHTVYGGVKAFGRIFAESLWLELGEYGVDVLELVLGVTRTPAMERVGLDFTVPGMTVSEPDDVAREGLSRLGHGPVHIMSGNEAGAAQRNDPDRAAAVLRADKGMRRLMGLPERVAR